jgi:hypothetical protein
MHKIFVALASVIGLSACQAWTDTTSFVDPDTLLTTAPASILVFGSNMQLNARIAAESAMAETLSANKVRAIRSVDLMPPTRTFSEGDFNALIEREGIDSVLILTLDIKGSSTGYMPQTTMPSQTTGTALVYGNMLNYQSQTTPGATYGGYS